MNLYSFEEEVSPEIVERGMEYYEAGFVTNLISGGGGRYTAVVKGADMYEITVRLDDEGNILMSYCDCPFDMGPICRHEVAFYYDLIDRLKDNDFPEDPIKQPDLKETLENLSKAELVDILMDLANKEPVLYNELLFNYAIFDERHEIDRCRKLIDTITEKHTSDGFISYNSASGFASELRGVLNKIRTLKNPLISIEIAGLLLVEAVQSIQYTNDSGGDLGSLVDETIKTMHFIAGAPLDVCDQSEMLDKLIHLSKNKVFEGWEDIRIDVLGVCLKFAGNEKTRITLMKELESMIVNSSATDYNRYSNERILNFVYDIIETYDSTDEAMQFLHENVNYPTFRKRLMQFEMTQGNYESVLTLASEGERMDQDYRGLVSRWKKWRYKAYEQMKLLEEQALVGRELLMEGHFEYYSVLKEIAAEDPSFYDELKQQLKKQNHKMYIQLIEAENDVDAILDYVRENPLLIERYLQYPNGFP